MKPLVNQAQPPPPPASPLAHRCRGCGRCITSQGGKCPACVRIGRMSPVPRETIRITVPGTEAPDVH